MNGNTTAAALAEVYETPAARTECERRAATARASFMLYGSQSGGLDDSQSNLTDLLADLQHLAAVDGLDWLHAVASAEMHVIAERRGE